MRRTFAVGRLTPETTEIVLVRPGDGDRDRERPVPGPWSLRAIVRAREPSSGPGHTTPEAAHATSRRVH